MAQAGPRPLVAGNWKMNGLKSGLSVLAEIRAAAVSPLSDHVDLLVCPPATLVAAAVQALAGSAVAVGGQDCRPEASGAFTGDISAEMLADAGATAVIVGHSERRQYHGESDADVRAKAAAAHRAGLLAVLCLGETLEQREAGRALEVVQAQLEAGLPDGANADNLVVAYEPVWAIGTGRTPTTADVAEVHARLRETLGRFMDAQAQARTRILYGGSVKPANARELLSIPNVDGALVGGASLVAADFLAIARAKLPH